MFTRLPNSLQMVLFFCIGVLCFFGTRPTYPRLPDRSTSPND